MSGLLIAEAVGTWLDHSIIIGYFVFILAFGTFFGRFSKSTRDFFFGGQRFAWWLIGMSMVATGVGSYSFIKYSAKGFEYGMSSSMTYTNDWFFIPFFMFGWLPIIYFSRVRSIPEYFQRRFDGRSRLMAVVILLMYMLAYIGFNIYTLGVAAERVLGTDLYVAMGVIAVVSAIYMAVGGQTAVIFTDLVQGFMLLAAGVILAFLGLDYLGMDGGIVAGLRAFWTHLNLAERLPFAGFNRPPDFNFVGIFWQDGFASSITFLFINQGLIMRFLAAKSVNEGRKTILFNTLFLLPISAIVVGNAGWIGNAMEAMGMLESDTDPKSVFIEVAKLVCAPGVFGFVLAALTAALMSTIDTLTNAVAALFVFDVYQPYLAKRRSDRHYLSVARIVSLASSGVAFAVGVSFSYYPDMYQAHANFVALITPPIVVAVFLGAFWKGYTPSAAFWSMFGGAVLTWSSKKFPFLVAPFATWLHGVEPGPDGTYTYMTAFFGITATAVLGVTISMFTRPKPEAEIVGLWIGSIELGKRRFKGGKPNYQVGRKICAALRVTEVAPVPVDAPAADSSHLINQEPHLYPCVRLSAEDMSAMKAEPGDLLYIADARRWLGGLRSLHCRAALPHDEGRVVLITAEAFEAASFLAGREVRVEKTL